MNHILRRYQLSPLLLLVVFMVQQGCIGHPIQPRPGEPWAPHVSQDVRGKIRTIEMEIVEELPRVTIEAPSKDPGSGAGRKARKWSRNWIWGVKEVFEGGAAAAPLNITTAAGMLVLTPVVAAAGAVYGAFDASSPEMVESQEAQIRGVLNVEELIHRFHNHFHMQVANRTDISISSSLMQTGDDPIGDRKPSTASRGSQPDSILKVLVQSVDLRSALLDVDPLLALNLKVQATLLSVPPADVPLYTHTYQYVSRARRLTEWVSDDAQVFRDVVELSLARLAELMVDDLFLIHPFVHEHQRLRRDR